MSDEEMTRVLWVSTMLGLLCSAADTMSDLLLGIQYFREGRCVCFALTLTFIVVASVVTQIFSYAWFRDDGPKDKTLTKFQLITVHLLHMGFFTRHLQLLKASFGCVWCGRTSPASADDKALSALRDLSMLRLFETFLESVPQLLLQLYIVLQQQDATVIQSLSMVVSFLSTAWTLVDFWRCLRRSLPQRGAMLRWFPAAVYLLYKALTISARILGLVLLLKLNLYCVLVLLLQWLLCGLWTHKVKTEFCTSLCLEILYRAMVAFILIFTFFNIKGQNTKVPMIVYYVVVSLQNISAPLLLFILSPSVLDHDLYLTLTAFILVANTMGLFFLALYYWALHPTLSRQADVVDGIVPSLRQRSTLVL
ncbi:XK-related protein 9 [Hoplias malabaricus]|uniref:XK-related protein 9 n=1 Tax=Hoplias malabaricus TaxID=27720 RepID=UPI003461B75F